MTYHLALSSFVNLEEISKDAEVGKCPAHVIFDVSRRLNATIHQANSNFLIPMHLICESIIGCRKHWNLA
ncbi:MAG: glycosyl transferase, partial [Cyanobacteria bacterium J06633_8]